MSRAPLFSIIIPTYNRAEMLFRALSSVGEQTFKDFEVIVIDDGSTDNTKNVADRFAKNMDLEYLYSNHWGGPARPKNTGIKIARGDYIAFLDTDDWWYPRKLEIVHNYLRKGDIFYHDLDLHTKKGKCLFKKIKGRKLKKPVFSDLLRNENALINSSVVVKRYILERVGGFAEAIDSLPLFCFEDFDLYLKISRITDRFIYVPRALGAYWIENGNVSGASEGLITRIEAVYNKYIPLLINKHDIKCTEAIKYYLLARNKQKIGLIQQALEMFKLSVKSVNLKIKIRSLIWLMVISSNIAFKRLLCVNTK